MGKFAILQGLLACLLWAIGNPPIQASTLLRQNVATYGVSLSNEPVHEISNNVVYATSKASNQPAHTRCLIRAFASRLSIL